MKDFNQIMKTITVQIGNSDDKLTQKQWAEFVSNTIYWITKFCSEIHFSSGSPSNSPWQNYSITFEIDDSKIVWVKENLIELRKKYNQNSIAWMECNTDFI